MKTFFVLSPILLGLSHSLPSNGKPLSYSVYRNDDRRIPDSELEMNKDYHDGALNNEKNYYGYDKKYDVDHQNEYSKSYLEYFDPKTQSYYYQNDDNSQYPYSRESYDGFDSYQNQRPYEDYRNDYNQNYNDKRNRYFANYYEQKSFYPNSYYDSSDRKAYGQAQYNRDSEYDGKYRNYYNQMKDSALDRYDYRNDQDYPDYHDYADNDFYNPTNYVKYYHHYFPYDLENLYDNYRNIFPDINLNQNIYDREESRKSSEKNYSSSIDNNSGKIDQKEETVKDSGNSEAEDTVKE